MDEQILFVPIPGTAAYVRISILGHNHRVAAMLRHPQGAGRWIDRYEVKRKGDPGRDAEGQPVITDAVFVTESLAEARDKAAYLYREAALDWANHLWVQAEAACPHIASYPVFGHR